MNLDAKPRILRGASSLTMDTGAYESRACPFEITKVGETALGAVQLTWRTRPGQAYVVQTCNNLCAGSWPKLGPCPPKAPSPPGPTCHPDNRKGSIGSRRSRLLTGSAATCGAAAHFPQSQDARAGRAMSDPLDARHGARAGWPPEVRDPRRFQIGAEGKDYNQWGMRFRDRRVIWQQNATR